MERINTQQCICGTKLIFDTRLLSHYENFDGGKFNQKPRELESGEFHECPLRGWSHELKCKTCSGPIVFNNKFVGPKGHKIPHDPATGVGKGSNRELKKHVCVVVKQ